MIYRLFQDGIEVCRGASPPEQGLKCELVSKHTSVIFKQTKQNSTWQRLHMMFLHPVVSCSTRLPQVGQARMDGQLVLLTAGRIILQHLDNFSTSGLTQPMLSQRSERGPGPFHSFMHCQQKLNVLPISSVQIVHMTQRLVSSALSTIVWHPGHWRYKEIPKLKIKSVNAIKALARSNNFQWAPMKN